MKKIFEETAPSEEFWDAICYAGSNVINCELCGRVHFVSKERDLSWEEGELEELIKKSEENPDEYVIDNDDDSISWGIIDGKQAVYGCPCNGATRYERFFWNSRYVIADYLKNRARALSKTAKS